MKTRLYVALAALLFCAAGWLSAAPAHAADSTRVCTPLYNSSTGAMSCVDVGQTGPGGTVLNGLPVSAVVVAACGTPNSTPTTALAFILTIDVNGYLCTSSTGGGGGGGPATIADGADVAEGATGDAAWSGSGSGTVVAILKAVYAAISNGVGATGAAVPADAIYVGINTGGNLVGWTGQVTANAGTNLNTSALALDTSVGTTNTDLGALGSTTCATDTGSCNVNAKLSRIAERLTSLLIATAVTIVDGGDVTQGAVADAAYAGSGNATVIAALKGIYNVASSSLAAGSAIIGNVRIDQTTPGTTNGVAIVGVNAATALAGNGATGTGSQRVTIASDNTAFSVNAQPTPVTSGGLSVYFVQPAASDNHVVIKAGAGQVYKISVTNNSATINYLRLYNATTGFNGCNSATNLVYQMAIPASTSGAGYSDSWESGIAFATGISICISSGYATTDTTNATASAMSVNVGYK